MGSWWMQAGCQGNQPCEERMGLFSPMSEPPGMGEDLKVESLTNGHDSISHT